jgi:hypothetical protein
MREFYWQSGSKANGGVDGDSLLVVSQLAERRWDSNFFWHKLKLLEEVYKIKSSSYGVTSLRISLIGKFLLYSLPQF